MQRAASIFNRKEYVVYGYYCKEGMVMKSNLEREVKKILPFFRYLADWKVTVDKNHKIYNQCSFDVRKKTAVIYRKTADISDRIYALHEVLHLAFIASFREKRPYSRAEINYREERFIEEICAYLFLNLQ